MGTQNMIFTVEVDWTQTATWVDETSYVLSFDAWLGFASGGESVAAVGNCSVLLDNSSRRFSPGYGAGALFGDLVPRREIRVLASDGVTTWSLFRGFIQDLVPTAGEHGGDETTLVCVDGISILSRQRVSIELEDTIYVDDAVDQMVSLGYTPPAVSYDDNGDELTHFGRSLQPERDTLLQALVQICQSFYGRFYVARDGTATYITRELRMDASGSVAIAIDDDTPVKDLDVVMAAERLGNLAQITIYPVETLGAFQAIWTAQTVLYIPAGSERIIYTPFRDDLGERVGAVDVVEPVATLDYLVNSSRDGGGVDLTGSSSFSMDVTIEATRAKLDMSNTSGRSMYVVFLQIRGKPIVVYDPIEVEESDSGSIAEFEMRGIRLDLPMQSDYNFAQSYVEYLVSRLKAPALVAQEIAINDCDVVDGVNVFSLGLLDMVSVSDDQVGMDGDVHFINAIEYRVFRGGRFMVKWVLERGDDARYCFLDRVGFDELDEGVLVGF